LAEALVGYNSIKHCQDGLLYKASNCYFIGSAQRCRLGRIKPTYCRHWMGSWWKSGDSGNMDAWSTHHFYQEKRREGDSKVLL